MKIKLSVALILSAVVFEASALQQRPIVIVDPEENQETRWARDSENSRSILVKGHGVQQSLQTNSPDLVYRKRERSDPVYDVAFKTESGEVFMRSIESGEWEHMTYEDFSGVFEPSHIVTATALERHEVDTRYEWDNPLLSPHPDQRLTANYTHSPETVKVDCGALVLPSNTASTGSIIRAESSSHNALYEEGNSICQSNVLKAGGNIMWGLEGEEIFRATAQYRDINYRMTTAGLNAIQANLISSGRSGFCDVDFLYSAPYNGGNASFSLRRGDLDLTCTGKSYFWQGSYEGVAYAFSPDASLLEGVPRKFSNQTYARDIRTPAEQSYLTASAIVVHGTYFSARVYREHYRSTVLPSSADMDALSSELFGFTIGTGIFTFDSPPGEVYALYNFPYYIAVPHRNYPTGVRLFLIDVENGSMDLLTTPGANGTPQGIQEFYYDIY